MGSNKFNKTLFWLLLSGFTCGVAGLYLLILTQASLFGVGLIGLSCVTFIQLFRLFGQTERDVLGFLQSIEYEDFSRRFEYQGKTGQSQQLAAAFDKILIQFQQLKLEHQQQTQLLKTVIAQIGSGIILIDHKQHITIKNAAAQRQLNIPGLKLLSQITDQYPQLRPTLNTEQGHDTITLNGCQFQLNSHKMRVGSQSYQLLVLNNIHDEMESNEIASWQKLISILIHEISNSITPISSLAATADDMITQSLQAKIDELGLNDADLTETITDVHQSISTISRRSQGLINFVDEYRKLTHIKAVNKKPVLVIDLIRQIKTLLSDELAQQQVDVTINVEPLSLSIAIDQPLIEQVLINIFINALHATQQRQSSAKISVNGYINDYAKAIIEISDNGTGMTQDAQTKIFTPFYTTKPKGSGIGLALARQIMHKHQGAIQVNAELDKGSSFRLIF